MISDDKIREALINEYEWMCHECLEPGEDTPEEYAKLVATLNREQLLIEAMTDEYFTLEEFIDCYAP